jgi:hypothetical protein
MELISRDKLLKQLVCDEANYENIVEQNGDTDHFTGGMLIGIKLAIASVLQATTEENFADETKELKRLLHDMKNDLCALCGKDKEAHEGACDDCRWREV